MKKIKIEKISYKTESGEDRIAYSGDENYQYKLSSILQKSKPERDCFIDEYHNCSGTVKTRKDKISNETFNYLLGELCNKLREMEKCDV